MVKAYEFHMYHEALGHAFFVTHDRPCATIEVTVGRPSTHVLTDKICRLLQLRHP